MDQQVIEGEFQIADWKESTIAEFGTGGKLTEAKVTQKFSGGLKGEGSVTWCMCYTSDKSARFVGMQQFTGVLGSLKGGFAQKDTRGTTDTEQSWSHCGRPRCRGFDARASAGR